MSRSASDQEVFLLMPVLGLTDAVSGLVRRATWAWYVV